MAGKVEIPEQIKSELPQTKWGKILGVTPIVMTVIATMLAGLASSEMTKAQYDRSFAAQLQSKAGDQWSYYQAKKLRSAVALNQIEPATLAGSLTAAQNAATAFDDATKPINKASDKFDESLMAGDKNVFRSFSAARLRYTSARYRSEEHTSE